jgi:hypothetical protein
MMPTNVYRGSRSAELRVARNEMARARQQLLSGQTAIPSLLEGADAVVPVYEEKPNEVPM